MTIRAGKLWGLLLGVVLVWGCSGSDLTGGPYTITEYFPLAEDDVWSYRDLDAAQDWTATVLAPETFNGQTAFPLKRLGAGLDDVQYYRSTGAGLYYLGWTEDAGSDVYTLEPAVLIPNGLSAGDDYATTSTLYLNGAVEATVQYDYRFDGDVSVRVAAGDFPAALRLQEVIVRDGSLTAVNTKYLVENVGLVRSVEQNALQELESSNRVVAVP
jgi:hypothetical protein